MLNSDSNERLLNANSEQHSESISQSNSAMKGKEESKLNPELELKRKKTLITVEDEDGDELVLKDKGSVKDVSKAFQSNK